MLKQLSAAVLTAAGLLLPAAADASPARFLDQSTIPDLQRAMDRRQLTSEQLTRGYLRRIEELNPRLHAVVQTNPDALAAAKESDARRRRHSARGALDGIPVLLKENTDTADRQTTTAGSTAMLGSRPAKDAVLVQHLRAAGAVVLGKTNLSEWSNFRSTAQIPGWSGVSGQTRNPYALDRSPCGSSSGSAVAAAAGLATVAIGTETDGSIVCPAAATSTVGVKTSLGAVSRSGVVPITAQHDTPGPIARNVTDAALTLSVLADADPASAGAAIPKNILLDRNALRGKRIGVWRKGHTGIDQQADRIFESTVHTLRSLGATVVDGADVEDISWSVKPDLLPALLTEFKHDLNAYLAATPGEHPRNLSELIAYNDQHRDVEMPLFDQNLFLEANATDGNLNDQTYRRHRAAATGIAQRSIDDVLASNGLDAIVTLSGLPASPLDRPGDARFLSSTRNTSVAGYPNITVPAGFAGQLPVGVSFVGTKYHDAQLLGFAYAYEQASHARQAPRYLPAA
ncbi:amidase [Amycolatopsis albidoflavus]